MTGSFVNSALAHRLCDASLVMIIWMVAHLGR
jgi:hypothetical protein